MSKNPENMNKSKALDKFEQRFSQILSNAQNNLGKHRPDLKLSDSELEFVVLKSWDKFCSIKRDQLPISISTSKSNNHNIVNNNVSSGGVRTVPVHKENHDELRPQLPVAPVPGKYPATSQNNASSSTPSFQIILQFLIFLFNIIETFIILIVIISGLYVLIVLHKPTQALISRNSQDLIYPFMRGLRLMTLPVLRKFPIISELYEESCLIPNPDYLSTMVNCWPCETVKNVVNLTSVTNFTTIIQNGGLPFITTDPNHVPANGIHFLHELNTEHPNIYQDFINLYSNHSYITNMEHVVRLLNVNDDNIENQFFHISWKINRITASRTLRKYFPKPKFVPLETEVSLQHYMMLDGQKSSSYLLPLTEFPNVYIAQVSGLRHIILIPTEMCQQKCRTVSALLQPTDILYYNFMYWRPVSAPFESDEAKHETFSLSYISSFH